MVFLSYIDVSLPPPAHFLSIKLILKKEDAADGSTWPQDARTHTHMTATHKHRCVLYTRGFKCPRCPSSGK